MALSFDNMEANGQDPFGRADNTYGGGTFFRWGRPRKLTFTTKQFYNTESAKGNILHRVSITSTCKTFEEEVAAIDRVFKDMKQVPYGAWPGPNSNTYARQLLENAGFEITAFKFTFAEADGIKEITIEPIRVREVLGYDWVYKADNSYGGRYYDTMGNLTEAGRRKEKHEAAELNARMIYGTQ